LAHFTAVVVSHFANRDRVGSEPVGYDAFNSVVAFQSFLQKLQSGTVRICVCGRA